MSIPRQEKQSICQESEMENMDSQSSQKLALLVVQLLLCFQSRAAAGSSSLFKGQSIKDGDTIISPNSMFELGFFRPNVSSPNRYLGIRYHSIPDHPVVWVANRDFPVPNSSASFTLRDDASLAVLLGQDRVLWSSSSTTASSTRTNITAQLQDDGNLVVLSDSTTIWQSFEHPGDTYLPGMRAGLDLKTNINTVCVSWKTQWDPSPGRFSMGLDPKGPWDGQNFAGSLNNGRAQYLYGLKFSNVGEEHKMYFHYTAYENEILRFVTMPSGILVRWVWNEGEKKWMNVTTNPSYECEMYNRCGDYGVCEQREEGPGCSCLEGFEKDPSTSGGGCRRRTKLGCGSSNATVEEGGGGDGFLTVEGLKLPDGYGWIANLDEGGCGARCSSNCSCQAYAYVSGIGCMVWDVSMALMDIQHFSSRGHDLHLKVAASEFGVKKKMKASITIIIIASIFGTLSLTILILWMVFKHRKRAKELKDTAQVQVPSFEEIYDEEKQENISELPVFSFQILESATNNFSQSDLIGRGGFGPVYKGVFPGGKKIAVKRLSMKSNQGMEEFKNEVLLIAKLQHRNLVRLLGCCIEDEEKLLVYEYMANKSLDTFIFDSAKKSLLDWKKRYNIIGGIARGLLYLHRDSRLTIIHRDLKTSNILLDEEMNPKISDFGMARIFQDDENSANTKRIVGTFGYMPLEYAMHGAFSVKSDVYSFGVILLEILSGIKNQSFVPVGASTDLLGYAWELWSGDNFLEFIDPLIRDNCSTDEAMKCLQVGLLCVQDKANDRPIMPSVVVMLENENSFSIVPKKPTFTIDRRGCAHSSNNDSTTNNSINYVTSTSVVGR